MPLMPSFHLRPTVPRGRDRRGELAPSSRRRGSHFVGRSARYLTCVSFDGESHFTPLSRCAKTVRFEKCRPRVGNIAFKFA